MNNESQETLRRVAQNDPSLTELTLLRHNNDYGAFHSDNSENFYSDNSDNYSTLGAAIANNTYLEELIVTLSDNLPLGAANRELYDSLKHNSSISRLELYCSGQNIAVAGGVRQEILQAYQDNNSQRLTVLSIYDADLHLQSGGDCVIGDTLRSCRKLQIVNLTRCSITDEQLFPIVDAVRGLQQLEELTLGGSVDNNIGYAGCGAIATLLTDQNCNVHTLDLGGNNITNEGATTIANSLVNNTKLRELCLYYNQTDRTIVEGIFSNILCNTSNINHTYSSNHTLETLNLDEDRENGQELESLLDINAETNKSHVAIRKILKYHPDIDMGPMFEWDAEGEQTLKALPFVVDWFERARVAVTDNDGESYHVEEKTLSAIFQFAKGMPLLFVPTSHIKVDNKKRKRGQSR